MSKQKYAQLNTVVQLIADEINSKAESLNQQNLSFLTALHKLFKLLAECSDFKLDKDVKAFVIDIVPDINKAIGDFKYDSHSTEYSRIYSCCKSLITLMLHLPSNMSDGFDKVYNKDNE